MKAKPVQRQRRGFLLLEGLIATAVFAISITGIIFALQTSAAQARSLSRERWVQKQFKNVLTEALKSNRTETEFQEGLNIDLGEFGAQGIVDVTPSELVNKDEAILSNLYQVKVTIVWYDNNELRQESIETLHYYPLYQP